MPVRRTTIRDSWTLAVAKWRWCNRLILPAQADCERSTPTIRKWCRRRRLPLRCVAQSVRFAHAVRRQRRRRHLILLPCNTTRQRFAHTVRRRPRRRRLPLRHAAPRQRCAYPIRRLCWGQHLPLRTAALCQRGAHAIRRRRGCCQLVLCPRRDGPAAGTHADWGTFPIRRCHAVDICGWRQCLVFDTFRARGQRSALTIAVSTGGQGLVLRSIAHGEILASAICQFGSARRLLELRTCARCSRPALPIWYGSMFVLPISARVRVVRTCAEVVRCWSRGCFHRLRGTVALRDGLTQATFCRCGHA